MAKEPPQTDGGEVSRATETGADINDPLSIAFERGRIAKHTGAQRRAVPGEYREEANKAELEAWLAGYDGKEIPTGETNGESA